MFMQTIEEQTPGVRQHLSTEEAAHYLGVSTKTLVNWRVLRIGPRFIQISNHCIRYALKDLEDWLAAKRIETRHTASFGDSASG